MDDAVYIPIPHYPPFQLRSSLIDKDPVIWAHLLEGYIQLCKALLSQEVKLDVKSQQQLQLFLKVYLLEVSEEATKIFSLGAINPDIRRNSATLRILVLQLIRSYSVVKLGLGGESLWNFVMIFVEKNATLVRGLIDGTFKSPMNDNKKSGKILLVSGIRKHLEAHITLGKFSKDHLKVLALLLGQHTAVSAQNTQSFLLSGAGRGAPQKQKVLAKDRNKGTASNALQFAETFVNEEWLETLEKLYAGGRSVHAEIVKNCMVLSVLSLSAAKLAKVISTLGINSGAAMALNPLLSAIILSESYKKLNPGLEERLPFLRTIKFKEEEEQANEKDVDFLVDIFPSLSRAKAEVMLLQNDNDVKKVTHVLLEDPLIIETIPEELEKHETKISVSESELQRGLERFKLQDNETTEQIKKKPQDMSSQEMKKKTLSAALKLLYESDEDERDDTYDDQEHTSGVAFHEFDRKPKNKDKARLAVFDGDQPVPQREDSPVVAPSGIDKTELNLFGYFKTNGEEAFDKTARKSKIRQEIRSISKWTDEQIEGWLRMLKKSPKRFRLLEEQYVFNFSNRNRQELSTPKISPAPTKASSASKNASPAPDKKANARNERQKASKANHNRKSGHNKKARAELAGMQ